MPDKKRVLIVDDERHIRTTLRFIIKRLGHEPYCAEDGGKAFEMMLENNMNNSPFDLLLCDLQMPVLTGEELIIKMKERKIPTSVLVVTGVGDKEIVVNLLRLGCRDFIDKPFLPEEIEERVSLLLEDINSKAVENNRKEFMARIGEKARETIHDLNNILYTMQGYTELAIEDTDESSQLNYKLNKVLTATTRATEICKKLLVKNSCIEPFLKSRTQVNILIERIGVVLKDILPSNIKIQIQVPTYPIWMEAESECIQQALLNMGLNSTDAMPTGGVLSIVLNKQKVKHSSNKRRSNDFIVISVQDEGCGINNENLPMIFNESFTTKEKGNGIGLYAVKRIVEGHDGYIQVKSVVGKGTTFKLFFNININDRKSNDV